MRALAFVALALLVPALAQAAERARDAERLHVETADGIHLAMRHWAKVSGPRPARTVLLIPDVGMTHRLFELHGKGLAPYLQKRQVEVFSFDWRGAGASDVPFGGYTLEALLDGDAEAAFARASEGRDAITVVGVGLGGTLALALAARHPEKVRGVVGLQALGTLEVPNEPTARLLAALDVAKLPPWIELASALKAPMVDSRSWFDVLLGADHALDGVLDRRVRKAVLAPVPRNLVAQLAQAMRERRLTLHGKDAREAVAGWRGRTLLVFAPRDNWAHPEYATVLRDVLDRARTDVLVLSKLEGAGLDAGHLGMLMGPAAESDVFKPLEAFVVPDAEAVP